MRGDVRTSYVFARVQFTRFRPVRGVCKHTVSTDSCLLHVVRRNRNTYRITGLIYSRKSGGCISLAVFLSSAARRAHGSSAEHAMRDLIASHAPLRNGSHKARQNGPKHYPGDPMGAAAPLARLSPLSFVVQRKMGSPKGVGLAERQ